MKLVALLVVALGALGAAGCQVVFPLDVPLDQVPHVRPEDELAGTFDLEVPADETYTLDTQSLVGIGNNFQSLEPFVSVQPGVNTDLVVLPVRQLVVAGTLRITGEARPLVIIAETIEISGTIDASAEHVRPGPGGRRSGDGAPGEGGPGDSSGMLVGNNSGGGGGGFGDGAAPGGKVDCDTRSVEGGDAGEAVGDDALTVLVGGGAGGRGGSLCATKIAEGGGGGGALQLSASVSITITSDGVVVVGGGGGSGGLGTNDCAEDGGGAGGGAGGAIYLDAATIVNDGTLQAHGGGAGAGGRGASDGAPGNPGNNANDSANPSAGGFGVGKGTSGGQGANPSGAAGSPGMCDGASQVFNTGGGGGGLGRIVLRGEVERAGTISPTPTLVARPAF